MSTKLECIPGSGNTEEYDNVLTRRSVEDYLLKRARNKEVKSKWISHFENFPGNYHFTGTLRQQFGDLAVHLTHHTTFEDIQWNVRIFVRKLSRKLYGSTSANKEGYIDYVGSIEGDKHDTFDKGTRLHVHLSLCVDEDRIRSEFKDHIDLEHQVNAAWAETKYGLQVSKLQSASNAKNFAEYCLKDFQLEESERYLTSVPFS